MQHTIPTAVHDSGTSISVHVEPDSHLITMTVTQDGQPTTVRLSYGESVDLRDALSAAERVAADR